MWLGLTVRISLQVRTEFVQIFSHCKTAKDNKKSITFQKKLKTYHWNLTYQSEIQKIVNDCNNWRVSNKSRIPVTCFYFWDCLCKFSNRDIQWKNTIIPHVYCAPKLRTIPFGDWKLFNFLNKLSLCNLLSVYKCAHASTFW